jgi:hypothetical protein
MGNIGLPYKSGLGSCLQQGMRGIITQLITPSAMTANYFYQPSGIRISGFNETILANEPFIFTQRLILDEVFGATGGGFLTKDGPYYKGCNGFTSFTNNGPTFPVNLIFSQSNDSKFYFSLTYDDLNIQTVFGDNGTNAKKGVPINVMLYKSEGHITAATSYRVYFNGKYSTGNYGSMPVTMPNPSKFSSITFSNISFGSPNNLNFFGGSMPSKIFNNSVFRVDSGLTTSYIDEVALQLHRVDNYIHLLPTSYTIVNPSKVLYYFPLYLKEGKDIRDYYNPTKKLTVRLTFGTNGYTVGDVNFTTGTTYIYGPTQPAGFTTPYELTATTKPASVYKGPYNIWRKPYPPYDPYI